MIFDVLDLPKGKRTETQEQINKLKSRPKVTHNHTIRPPRSYSPLKTSGRKIIVIEERYSPKVIRYSWFNDLGDESQPYHVVALNSEGTLFSLRVNRREVAQSRSLESGLRYTHGLAIRDAVSYARENACKIEDFTRFSR